MAFISCLTSQKKRPKKHRLPSEPNTNIIVNSAHGGMTQSSGSTTASTKFLEFHPLPLGMVNSMHEGSRISGDILNATSFVLKLIGDEGSIRHSALKSKLKKVGFSDVEAAAFKEIMGQFIIDNSNQPYTYENLLPFFSFFFDKARKSNSIVDFGFDFIDVDNDGSICQAELAEFLYLFWNGKVENVLKTKWAYKPLKKFIKKQALSENFEFYMKMRDSLKDPYLNKEKFIEIQKVFIEPEAPKPINISSEYTNSILNYNEVPEVEKLGLVKSKVLRNAAIEIKYLMTQQIGNFTKQAMTTEVVAKKIFDKSKYSEENEWKEEEFQQFLIENLSIAAFISDIRTLILKGRNIAINHLRDSATDRVII